MFIVLQWAVLLILHFAFYLFNAVEGDIIRISDDKEAVVGGVVVLECSTDLRTSEDAIEWLHKGVDEAFMIVYKKGIIFNGFNGRAYVDRSVTNGEYNLVITKVKLDDAGTYTCMETTGKKQKLELTVFAVVPSAETCSSSIHMDSLEGFAICDTESVTLTLSCRMTYRGNTDAILEWKSSNTSLRRAVPFIKLKNDKEIKSNITVTLSRTTNYNYTCGIRYQKSSLISTYIWSSSFQVHPLSSSTAIIEASCDQRELDCSVNYKEHKCNYTWASDKGIVHDGEVLHLTNLTNGNYTCTARCTLQENRKCDLIAIIASNKKCDSGKPTVANSGSIVGALITALATAAAAIIVSVFLYRYRRKKRQLQQKQDEGDHDAKTPMQETDT